MNTALPFVRGDAETIGLTEAFLRDGKLRIEVFAFREGETGAGDAGEARTFALLDRTRPPLHAGESVEVHVVVRNLGVGHTFPGGTNDSNESWIEFFAADGEGREIARSGRIEEDGRLSSDAHVYQAVFVNGESHRIFRRDPQNFRALVFARTIGPGTADVARYRLHVPAALAGRTLTIGARLRWRKFERGFTEFVYEGKDVPDLPVTTIAEHRVDLPVLTPGSPGDRDAAALEAAAAGAPPEDWIRFNDHGIGLLLQGDTKGALDSFRAVEVLDPGRIDGPRNQARVWLSEGNLERAVEKLRRCEEIRPGDAQTAWFWADALVREGRYEEAAQAYRRVLEVFPGDRAAWMGLGRALFLDGAYEESLRALLRVLAIDPEHREAHYHRMLCYRALGASFEAGEAEKAYRKYQIDEDAAQRTNAFRRADPAVNFESLPIHVHG